MNDGNPTPLSRCGDCRFYDPLATVCRREPPKAIPMPAPEGRLGALAIWPPVDANRDWCGLYVQDPNAARGSA